MNFAQRFVRTNIALALAIGGAAAIAPSAHAADKITIIVGGYEKQIYLPAKLVERLGYFKEQGLDVELALPA